MGWNFPWTESIKKRISKYFLQRYLGSFLREKLTLDQLSVDIYNGTGSVHDLHLDVEKINEVLESVGAPVELVDGFVRRVTVSVPWSGLLTHSTSLEVEGLELTLKPNPKCEGGEMDISRLSQSMTSSLQLAQDCLSSTGADAMLPPAPASSSSVDEGTLPEGLEAFVKTIDFVLEHIRVTFLDTVARLEYVLPGLSKGVALEVRIKRAEYFDEAASESGTQPTASSAGSGGGQGRSAHTFSAMAAFVTKNIHLSGIALFTDEFCTDPESTRNASLSETSSLDQFHSLGSKSPYHSVHASLSSVASPDSRGEQTVLSKPVQCGALLGEQRLKLRLKLNEQVAGPVLAAEIRLGSAGVFFSPRQVHAVSLLLGQLSSRSSAAAEDSPESEEWTEALPSLPHRLRAYADTHNLSGGIVDAQMLQSINIQDDGWGHGLRHQPHMLHMDRTATVDSQMFLSARMDNTDVESSASAWGSQSSGFGQSSTTTASVHHAIGSVEQAAPPSAMRMTVTAELAFTLAVLVHDNLMQSCEGFPDWVGDESGAELELAAQRFFSGFAGQRTKGVADLKVIRNETIDYCPSDHLKLIAKSFKLEMKQQHSLAAGGASVAASNITATLGNCEITEWADSRPRVKGCDARPYHSELLTFTPRDSAFTNAGTMAQSIYEAHAGSSGCIKISVTSSMRQHSRRHRQRRQRRFRVDAAHTVINMQLLRSFHSEVDVSLYDRLYNLRTPPPTFSTGSSHRPRELYMDDNSISDPMAFVLSTECDGDIVLRFPIADLRGHNGEAGAAERLPWQWRHLRPEALHLHVSEPSIRVMLAASGSPAANSGGDDPASSVEITFADVTCSLLIDNGSEERDIFCARKDFTTSAQQGDHREPCRPSIVLTWKPEQPTSVFQPLSPDKSPVDSSPRADSLSDIMQMEAQMPSPFSGQRTLCNDAAQFVITPGTKREMKAFADTFSSSAAFTIGIHIPHADIVLSDHTTLELLYNRLCNDLLMWEPLSPSGLLDAAPSQQLCSGGNSWRVACQAAQAFAANICMNPATSAAGLGTGPSSFPQAAAGLSYGSSVDDCSSVGGSSSITSLASTDSRARPARPGDLAKPSEPSCKAAVQLVLDRATVLVCHSVDAAMDTESQISGLSSSTACFPAKVDQSLPVTLAEFAGCSIFVASEANGDPTRQLCSVQLNQFILYHAADFLADSWPTLEGIDSAVNVIKSMCQPLVYLRDEDDSCTAVDGNSGKDGICEDMLAVGIQLMLDPVRKLKDILVALRLSSAMVVPYSADPMAFIRLKEFFELTDNEILGYTFPKVVTEFHAQGMSCAADIRLPTSEHRALLVVERVEVMSNVVTNSPVNALSLVIDDAALFLAKVEWQQQRQQQPAAPAADNRVPPMSASPCIVISDDVCIIDIGHFNSIFRTSDGSDRRYPKIDIQVECNIVHVRTCHDSLQALITLVQRLLDYGTGAAADEDGSTPVPSITSSAMSSSGQVAMFESSSSEREPEGGQYIPTLLDEAMSELSPQGTVMGSVRPAPAASGHRVAVTTTQAGLHTSMAARGELAPNGNNGREHSKSSDDTSCYVDDDFYLVEPFPTCEEPRVEFLGGTSEPLRCRDYFERPLGRADQLKAPSGTYPDEVEYRYILQNLSVIWHLYGGEDFGTANTHASVGRSGTGTVKMGKAARQARGGRGRDIDNLIELQLSRFRAQHEQYCPDTIVLAPFSRALEPHSTAAGSVPPLATTPPAYVSRTCLLLNDIEVRDRLQTSSIDKLLYLHSSEKLPKQTHTNAMLVKIVRFKAEPAESADEECNIRVSVQPLRLNLDQDAILFVHSFFTKAVSSLAPSAAVTSEGRLPRRPSSASVSQEPKASMPAASTAVTAAADGTDLISEQASLRHVVFDEMSSGQPSSPGKPSGGLDHEEAESQRSLFIKNFEFTPDLYLRLDYVGKGFSSSSGFSTGSDPALPPIVRLVAGLAHLNRVELRLRELRFRHGILGVERLLQECLRAWQHDLRDQLAVVVGGVGPASSLVQIYNGVRDLFLLPLEQYRKDGRIAFGLRRGANAFGVSTAAAFLELTNTAVQAVLLSAELVFDLLSPTTAITSRRTRPAAKKKRRAPPADVRQGLVNAAEIVTDGFCDTTNRIVSVATVEHAEKGLRGAIGGVLRQLPTVAMEPVIVAAKGTSEMLLAARNQLVPDALREERNKWRHQGDNQ